MISLVQGSLEPEAPLSHLQTSQMPHTGISGGCGGGDTGDGGDGISLFLAARALVLLPHELHAGLGADVDLIAARASSGSGCAAPLAGLGSV